MVCPTAIKNLFIKHYSDGIDPITISKMLCVSITTIYRWSEKYNKNIVTKVPIKEEENKYMRESKSDYFVSIILDFCLDNPGCTGSDIMEHINFKLSKSTVNAIVRKCGLTSKAIKIHSVGKSIEEINDDREEFASNMIKKKFFNIINIDEVSFDIGDYKRRGYSLKSEPIETTYKHKKTKERRSVICATSKDGLIVYEIHEGTINGETFKDFIEKNKDKFIGKTLMYDNACIHHYLPVKDLVKKLGINVIYNAPYSPLFSPIEKVNNKAKTRFRLISHNDFNKAIIDSFNTITKSDTINFYRACFNAIKFYKQKNK